MHQSMISRGCRLQRLMADPDYNHLTQVQDLDETRRNPRRNIIQLTSSRYTLLFNLLAGHNKWVVHRNTFPVPRRHWLLSGLVTPVQSINCDGVVVGTMPPRNCVVANVGGKMRYGLVRQCYLYKNRLGEEREFLVISTISDMYPKVTESIPTRPFRYLLFLFGMVVGKVEDDEEALLPSQVTSLAAYRLLDQDTFSIRSNGIALIPRGYDAFLNISGHE
ncbi:hypothetical protein VP01_2063g5 [Puccinia sorghi]|uniref:Uncharacterized protein n=1 Tax=Puccinia sorghi TaxID=27349 RepID=A0A0L6VB80_9BASI|nr:hypothetical protein VP01_2063g5 [Puccinia sorghi]